MGGNLIRESGEGQVHLETLSGAQVIQRLFFNKKNEKLSNFLLKLSSFNLKWDGFTMLYCGFFSSGKLYQEQTGQHTTVQNSDLKI